VKIGVASLRPGGIQLEATERPDEISLTAERVAFPDPVTISVKVTRMQEDVLAQGEARTTARLECSRCLDDVAVPLHGRFEALFVPKSRAEANPHRLHDWGDQRVSFYSESTIDLGDEIAQCLISELPMRPLCRPDCAGLCPTCGHNRNEGPCSCPPEEPATPTQADSPFAALRSLFPPKPPKP
jgi:uncharacterized protein